MSRPRKLYRIKKDHWNGRHFYDLLLDGKKFRLIATNQEAAEAEAATRYEQIILRRNAGQVAQAALGPRQPAVRPETGSLREAVTAYLRSDTFGLYKPTTVKQRRSMLELIMRSPASSGRHVLGDSLLIDWLHSADARDAVLRIMGSCGDKVEAAHRRLIALDQFFKWLLGDEPQAAEARIACQVNVRTARNPCKDVEPPQRKRSKNGSMRRGHTAFTNDQVEEWLEASTWTHN